MSIPQSGGGPVERFEQLAEYLEAGCKPMDDWRIGTEHEKFGYCKDTLKPLPYDGPRSIKAMLEGIRDRYGWDAIEEQGKIIGLVKDGANISLEPGGQFELSGAPLETIHQTCDEVNEHLREVQGVADGIGARFIGLGAAPEWTHEQMPMMPKGRYRLMTDYMGRVGTHGTQMMYRTCTVQVNLDFGSEADMVKNCGWRSRCNLSPPRFSPIHPSSKASPMAINPGAAASGATSIRRGPACCLLFSRRAWGFSAMSITRSMCRCISSTATASI